jgi:DNA-binding response OmpR family regulator
MTTTMRILVIEADRKTAFLLNNGANRHPFAVDQSEDASDEPESVLGMGAPNPQ